MAFYVLANSVNYFGAILTQGKIVDSNAYDIAQIAASGGKLLPYNAETAARAELLAKQKAKGQALSFDIAQNMDAVSTYVSASASGESTDAAVFTAVVGVALHDMVKLSAADVVDKADATAPANAAIGMAKSVSGNSAVVQTEGQITGFVGLVPGATYYLSTTPGAFTATAPSGAGQIVQKVGVAVDAATLELMVDRDFVLL